MDFNNPMEFKCQPNQTDPHYTSEGDFRRFVAYGMLVSSQHLVGDGTDAIHATEEDVYCLRENFLKELENALHVLSELKVDAKDALVLYDGIGDEGGIFVPCENNSGGVDENGIYFEWKFVSYDADHGSCLLFELIEGNNAFPIWLAESALKASDIHTIIFEAYMANSEVRYEK